MSTDVMLFVWIGPVGPESSGSGWRPTFAFSLGGVLPPTSAGASVGLIRRSPFLAVLQDLALLPSRFSFF